MNVIVCKLIQKAVDFIVSPRRVLISNFKQLYRIAEALFEMFIALLIEIAAPRHAMCSFTKDQFKNNDVVSC